MKKLTKKQRHDFYKKILNINLENSSYGIQTGVVGFCDASSNELFGSIFDYRKIKPSMFPEYFMFKPKNNSAYWFADENDCFRTSMQGNDVRQLVLMFCIEMTR